MKQVPDLSGKISIDEFVSKIKKNKVLQVGKQRQNNQIQKTEKAWIKKEQ